MRRTLSDLPSWFSTRVKFSSEEDCWIWIGVVGSLGYGQMPRKVGTTLPHRFIYEFLREDIPYGLTIDHLCRVKNCVNPNHMEVVTRGENTLRSDCPSAKNKRKTHCSRGHMFTEENSIKSNRGRRICRECHRQDDLIYWRKVRAK